MYSLMKIAKTVSIIMVLLAWAFLSAWVYANPSSTTYYVSPKGDNSNPGTLKNPWIRFEAA